EDAPAADACAASGEGRRVHDVAEDGLAALEAEGRGFEPVTGGAHRREQRFDFAQQVGIRAAGRGDVDATVRGRKAPRLECNRLDLLPALARFRHGRDYTRQIRSDRFGCRTDATLSSISAPGA